MSSWYVPPSEHCKFSCLVFHKIRSAWDYSKIFYNCKYSSDLTRHFRDGTKQRKEVILEGDRYLRPTQFAEIYGHLARNNLTSMFYPRFHLRNKYIMKILMIPPNETGTDLLEF